MKFVNAIVVTKTKQSLDMFQVADCIMLMSLDQPAAIPVDTHMFQIAANQVKV